MQIIGRKPSAWRYQDEERCQALWLDCLLLAFVSRRPEQTELYPFLIADAAFAAAWAALDYWDIDPTAKRRLHQKLSQTSDFLSALRPERQKPGIEGLKERLLRCSPIGAQKIEVWAYLLAHWVERNCGLSALSAREQLIHQGWPLASFGMGYWKKDPVYYLEGDRFQKLVMPYAREDAFELLGPFPELEEPRGTPVLSRVMFGSLTPAKGLRSPRIWSMESRLGGIPGVWLTRNGGVHRQFAGFNLPEWFDAVEVAFDPKKVSLDHLLQDFWQSFHTQGDLLFYTEPGQKEQCLQSWQRFVADQPSWAVGQPLELHPCKWFEPARPEQQKLALRKRPVLLRTLAKIDLSASHLATKFNALADGYGSDRELVMLSARYGLSDGLTMALRTILYFSKSPT